ncbi:MAG: LptF/LptG family permease [Gemmatales bacterium]|nr:LptF/LptG family permease [Gemmatales bacterium]MDW8387205.1 LptF/LptG family permease [Gemmatales bacterium]
MTRIDRYLLRTYLQAWFICFFSLVSLYVVIDLFNKLDEFVTAAEATRLGFPRVVAAYYAVQLAAIFDRLYGVIVLLAAMFTLAWMIRNNELLPLLSAGVPTRRVLYPVLFGSLVMIGLGVLNRETILPQVAEQIEMPAHDPLGREAVPVQGAYEPNGILIAGQFARRSEGIVENFTCTFPERIGGGLFNLTAREARYVPPSQDRLSGGWLLTETKPARLPTTWQSEVLEELDDGKFFLRTERVTFDRLTRQRGWLQYASTSRLLDELNGGGVGRLTPLAVQLHLRFVVPLLVLIMAWMGSALLLRDQYRNVFLNAGLCLVLAGCFYAVCYATRYLGDSEYLPPLLAAWLPVLLFGPAAFVLHEGIHT